MRISLLFTTVLATDEVPHDPEALAFCHNACKVRLINPFIAAATFLMQIFYKSTSYNLPLKEFFTDLLSYHKIRFSTRLTIFYFDFFIK